MKGWIFLIIGWLWFFGLLSAGYDWLSGWPARNPGVGFPSVEGWAVGVAWVIVVFLRVLLLIGLCVYFLQWALSKCAFCGRRSHRSTFKVMNGGKAVTICLTCHAAHP